MLLTGIDKPSVVALKSLERRVKPANAWKLLIVLSPKMLFPPLVAVPVLLIIRPFLPDV